MDIKVLYERINIWRTIIFYLFFFWILLEVFQILLYEVWVISWSISSAIVLPQKKKKNQNQQLCKLTLIVLYILENLNKHIEKNHKDNQDKSYLKTVQKVTQNWADLMK